MIQLPRVGVSSSPVKKNGAAPDWIVVKVVVVVCCVCVRVSMCVSVFAPLEMKSCAL